MNEQIDALESLLASPGWKLFRENAAKEWSPSACWHRVRGTGPATMEQVDYTNKQVGLIVDWPNEELKRLKRQDAHAAREAVAMPSRRGRL